MNLPDLRAKAIIDVAAAIYPPIPLAVLLGPQRNAATVARRHAAMWVACQQGQSLSVIARAFRRDHTTVIHGRNRVDALLSGDEREGLRRMADVYAIKWIEAKLCR